MEDRYFLLCSAFRCDTFERHFLPTRQGQAHWLSPNLPRDLYAASIPADNPQTPDKIAPGKKLFFELVAKALIGVVTGCAGGRAVRREARVQSVWVPQRPEHPQRSVQRHPVLGRPRPEPRGAGEAADPQPDRVGSEGSLKTSSPSSAVSRSTETISKRSLAVHPTMATWPKRLPPTSEPRWFSILEAQIRRPAQRSVHDYRALSGKYVIIIIACIAKSGTRGGALKFWASYR